MRGPLGRDAYLPFRIIPHLEVTGHDVLHLPDPTTGPAPVSLMVSTDPEVMVHRKAGENGCQVQSDQRPTDHQRIHHVEVAPDTTVAKLILTTELPSGDVVELPLRVPIRRLRWGLISTQGSLGIIEWAGRLVRRPREAIMQAEVPQLVVEVPTSVRDSDMELTLSLLDTDGTELQQAQPEGARGSRRIWRFDLRAFRDTVRDARSPTLRFALTLAGLPRESRERSFPLLDLITDLVVEQINVESYLAGNCWMLELTWREVVRLRHREVRFWPLWRPWQPPVKRPDSDEANGSCLITIPYTDLRPGKYRVEFAVVDPWAPPVVPRRPPQGTLNTAEMELGTQSDRLRHLSGLPRDTLGYLEHALATENSQDRQEALHHLDETFEERDASPVLDVLLTLGTIGLDDDTEGEADFVSKVEALAAACGARLDAPKGPKIPVLSMRDFLGKLLLKHPCSLLREVASRVGYLDRVERAELRRLLLALGLLDSPTVDSIDPEALGEASLEALWQFWPPLGLMVDSLGWVQGNPRACHRVELHLGTQWLPRTTEYDESVDVGTHVPSLIGIAELFGGAPEAMTVEASAKQLQRIARVLRLVPQGLLDPDSWTEANLSWLIAVRTDPALEDKALRWLSDNLHSVYDGLVLLYRARLVSRPLAERLLKRCVQDPVLKLRNIPFLVGAVTLIQRTLAHFDEASRVLHGQETRWRHLGLQALDIASRLYTRDLCLFELVLAQYVSKLSKESSPKRGGTR